MGEMRLLLISCVFICGCSPIKDDGKEIATDIQDTIQQVVSNNLHQESDRNIQQTQLPLSISQALSQPKQTSDKAGLISVSAKNLPLNEFVKTLAEQTNNNIVLSPELTYKVTLSLKNVTYQSVIDILEELYPIDIIQESDHSFLIVPERLVTETFRIAGLNIVREGQSSTSIDGDDKSTSSHAKVETRISNKNSIKELNLTLKSLASHKDSMVNLNSHTGTATVKTTRKQMRKIKSLINSFNIASQKQVIIETKILEVRLNKKFKSGIDFSSDKLDFNFASGSFKFFNSKLSDPASSNTTGTPFGAIINMLSEQGNVHVLSSPRISTLNKQKALIKVGQDKYFLTQTDSSNTINMDQTNTVNQSMQVKPFFTGIALDVTPEVFDDSNILMHIHPVINAITEQRITSTIAGKDTSITVPSTDVRESDVMVHAKNGQVIVIGGLIQKRAVTRRESLPFVGNDVPIADNDSTEIVELVILLHPRISTPLTNLNTIKSYQSAFAAQRDN